jgi:folylpolyglutamate synthase/dihydropteroate synthase
VDDIIGAFRDVAGAFVFTAPASPRAASSDALAGRAAALGIRVPVTTAPDAASAVEAAARFGTPVVVAGSLYLAGEVLANLS